MTKCHASFQVFQGQSAVNTSYKELVGGLNHSFGASLEMWVSAYMRNDIASENRKRDETQDQYQLALMMYSL